MTHGVLAERQGLLVYIRQEKEGLGAVMSQGTEVFIRYYQRRFWANDSGSSGPNSAYEYTHRLRAGLADFLVNYDIESICDAGCGDANLFRYLDLGGRQYIGMDCVPDMIADNQKRFQSESNMRFILGDVVSDPLPKADVILCRDVVHYLPNDMIWQWLHNCVSSGSRYVLVTHNTHSALSANSPTQIGIFRPVNLTQAPFNLPAPQCVIAEDTFAKELALWDLHEIAQVIPSSF